jgi:hypothetical protein
LTRSFRKSPITGNTVRDSEKKDKRFANRIFRHRSKIALQLGEEIIPERLPEVSEVWDFAKDGKQYFGLKKYFHHDWYKQMWRK